MQRGFGSSPSVRSAAGSAHASASAADSSAAAASTSSPFEQWADVHVRLHSCFTWNQLADVVKAHAHEFDSEALSQAVDKVSAMNKRGGGVAVDVAPDATAAPFLDATPSEPRTPGSAADVASPGGVLLKAGDAEPSAAPPQSKQALRSALRHEVLSALGPVYMRLLPSLDAALSARLLHSFAVLGHNPAVDARGLMRLCDHLRECCSTTFHASSPEPLIDALWAVGKLASSERVLMEDEQMGTRAADPQLFSDAATVLYPRVHSLQSRYLSKLAHAFAMASVYYYPLLVVTVNAAKVRMAEFDAASLTNLVRCLSKLGYPDDAFYKMVADRTQLEMRKLAPRHIVTLVKAFATLKFESDEFYESASAKLQLNLPSLSASEITQVAWAFAVRNVYDVQLYTAIAFRAAHSMSTFQPQQLAMLIWAFARQGLHQRKLLDASTHEALRTLDRFSMQNMSNLVWAYARLREQSPELFAAVGARVTEMLRDPEGRVLEAASPDDPPGAEVYRDAGRRRVVRYADVQRGGAVMERVFLKGGGVLVRDAPSPATNRLFIAQNLSDLAWAFADAKAHDAALFGVLAQRATADMQHFSKTSLVDTAFGFASAKHYDETLFRAIEEASLPILPDFGPAYLSELLWSMATLGHQPGEAFVSAAIEITWNKWHRVTRNRDWLAKTIWALLKLEADKINPSHPLLAAFNEVLGQDDMSKEGAAHGATATASPERAEGPP